MGQAVVAGVGMVPFAKPGKSESYYQMGEKAARRALADAAVSYPDIQQAYVGYVYGDSTCGQAALYGIGLTGIPVVNVNNNGATGSSALPGPSGGSQRHGGLRARARLRADEVLSYEALGLTEPGTAEKFVLDGDNTYGGRVVTNPSGGLLSKGHPLGATGLAQCAELVWQLRGQAGSRQVEGATVALQHNLGLGGACVVTLYEKTGA